MHILPSPEHSLSQNPPKPLLNLPRCYSFFWLCHSSPPSLFLEIFSLDEKVHRFKHLQKTRMGPLWYPSGHIPDQQRALQPWDSGFYPLGISRCIPGAPQALPKHWVGDAVLVNPGTMGPRTSLSVLSMDGIFRSTWLGHDHWGMIP